MTLLSLLENRTSANKLSAADAATCLQTSERGVRLLVRSLRLQGFAIGSDNGYFIVSTEEEALAEYRRLRKHALSELEILKPFKKMLRPEQGRLAL